MAHGHPDARDYPIWRLWEEAEFVVDHINNQHVTQALLLQLAVSSLFSKDAGKEFQKAIKRLSDGSEE